jgi:hypothetical protein
MTRTTKIIAAGAVAGILAIAALGVTLTAGDTIAGGGDDDAPITGSALEQASAAALAHTGEGTVTDTEVEDEESAFEVEVTLDDGSQVDVQLDQDFNVVSSDADDDAGDDASDADDDDADDADDVGDSDEPITGSALEQASAAALAHTGEGTVTETEAGDEDSAYEVEVTLNDGTQVDVQLDENFNVVSDDKDGESADADDTD